MVIEFNARFGDPEAMNVLSLLSSDFTEVVSGITEGNLSEKTISFSPEATVCKYLVPEGYPDNPLQGQPVIPGDPGKAILYYANVEEIDGTLYTQSSRTLAYVGTGRTLKEAELTAEKAVSAVQGKVRHRKDIGTADLLEKRCAHMKGLR